MATMQRTAEPTLERESGIAMPLRAMSFAILGALTGRQAGPEPLNLLGGALAGVVFQAIGLGALALLLWAWNPITRKAVGPGGVSAAVNRGALLFVPFAVLGTLADLGLGWNAVQAFTSAGIMSSGAAVGAEVGKLGGGRVRSMIIPAAWCLVLTMAWIFGSSLAVAFLRSPA